MRTLRHLFLVVTVLTPFSVATTQVEVDAQTISTGITTMANSIPMYYEITTAYRYGITSAVEELAKAYEGGNTTLSALGSSVVEDDAIQNVLHILGDQEARFKAMSDRLIGLKATVTKDPNYGDFPRQIYDEVVYLNANLTAYYDNLLSHASASSLDGVVKSQSVYVASSGAMVSAFAWQAA
jgi:hypothetical protein